MKFVKFCFFEHGREIDMMFLNWPAIAAAVISIGSMVSIATGHPALAGIITDPNTAAEITAVIGGLSALVSAFAPSVMPKK